MERIKCDGAIYQNSYKDNDKKPDWVSKFEITGEFLKNLVEQYRENGKPETIEINVAMWDRVSKKGNTYKYAQFEIPQQEKKPEPQVEENDGFNDDDIPF